MKFLDPFRIAFWRWIDTVAVTLVALSARFRSSRAVRVVEQADGTFTAGDERLTILDGRLAAAPSARLTALMAKSRAELCLQPSRFVFRPLELPQRATEFLGGIVRAQIDRLTPWSAAEAVYGWTAPQTVASDRMVVTVVASARTLIAPLARAIADIGAGSIVVTTQAPGAEATPVKVFEHQARGELDVRRLRRALVALIGLMVLAAAAAAGTSAIVGADLEGQRYEIGRRIAERRVSAQLGRGATSATGIAVLERRKREVPSSVIVIEALSQILPDHTYLTELRIIGDRLQIVGLTRDAPSLIRLIEQSSHFTRATFFAPTTRSPGEPGEHFNIEARIEPVYSPGI